MADDFLEIRFPERISLGAIGGLIWPLRRVRNAGGYVFRDPLSLQPEGHWEVSHAVRRPAQYKPLRAFWMAVNGGAYGFRFKDWTDYTVDDNESALIPISTGVAQIAKRYQFGAEYFDRELQKIVPGTFVPVGGSGLSLDYDTGILTYGSAPTSFSLEFDCPCIFGTDEMRAETITPKPDGSLLIGWSNIPIDLIRIKPEEGSP